MNNHNNNNNNNNNEESNGGRVVLSTGVRIQGSADRMHSFDGRNFIVKPGYVLNHDYIAAQQAKGIIKPTLVLNMHEWDENGYDRYVSNGDEDGIAVPFSGSYKNLPYGVCGKCGFQIPQHYLATWKKEDGAEVDLCIICVSPNFYPAEFHGFENAD